MDSFEKVDNILTDIIDGLFSFIVYPAVLIRISRHKLKRKIKWEKEDIRFYVSQLDFYKLNPEFASAVILKYKSTFGLFDPETNIIDVNLGHHRSEGQIIDTIAHESLHKAFLDVWDGSKDNIYDEGEEEIIGKMQW